jgi:hypothetical protein
MRISKARPSKNKLKLEVRPQGQAAQPPEPILETPLADPSLFRMRFAHRHFTEHRENSNVVREFATTGMLIVVVRRNKTVRQLLHSAPPCGEH